MVATVQTDVRPTVTRSVKRPTNRPTPTDAPVILKRNAHDPTHVKVKGIGWCDEREAHILVKKFDGCTCGARNFFHCQCEPSIDYNNTFASPTGWRDARVALGGGIEDNVYTSMFRALEEFSGTWARLDLLLAVKEFLAKRGRPDLVAKIERQPDLVAKLEA